MRMVDLIEKKRDGGILTDDEIRFIIQGFTDGSIPDYQMSAFAMTVFYKGMTDHETAVLTDAMMRSGDTVDLSRFGDKSVDKHSTGGVGELSNFILGAMFVIPAGLFYKKRKGRKSALIGSLVGAVLMSVVSVASNYFIVYPVYTAFMPMEAIINAYQVILPQADTLLKCLVIFNMPFTFIKGMMNVLITFLVYKHISPIIKGAQER